MKRVIVIVHPFAYYVRFEEKNARRFGKGRKYNGVLLEEKLDMFRGYNSDNKIIILPSEEKDTNKPRISLMTKRISIGNGDLVISDMNPYSQLKKSIYPDWDRLALFFMEKGKIIADDSVIVGGFGIDDCVRKFIFSLERRGIKPLVDPKITDLYYRGLYGMIANGDFGFNMKIKSLNALDQERGSLAGLH
jgi:hypothetical protein